MATQSSGQFDLVICDIDGCLSPESHAPLNGESLLALAEHNRRAINDRDRPVVTLCSGRPIGFVECLTRLTHNTLVPCIGENGVWIWRPRDNSFAIDPSITEEHLEIVHEARRFLRSQYETRGVIQQPGKTASVALYHPDTGYLKSIRPEIAEAFESRGWPIRVSMTWLYINCDLQHVNKGTAIGRLFAETGIDSGRTAGIGDTMGDRFIAERVAWFACPANAEPEIRKFASYVSPQHEVGGVLDILGQLAR
ncbi:MAG: HAD family phosphatase [Planctomycetaceae bacterium]|nr:HAD family phosphatase [Planctomycetaceae bacterium]